MKRVLLAAGLTLSLNYVSVAPAQAKIPPEVMEPYKAYNAAVKAGDVKAALKTSYAAWQAAEKTLGDHKTTGDLAQNYADLKSDSEMDKQIDAMARAMELSKFHGENGPTLYMQRGVSLMQLHQFAKQERKNRKLIDAMMKYAEANGQTRSIFYAEVLTNKAGIMSQRRDAKNTKKYADLALDIFANPDAQYDSAYPIFAYLYKGFGHEYDDEVLEAALSYQKVMDYVGKLDYGTHPVVGRALGRWSHMRGRLKTAGTIDDAREAGLCDCWPYDIERNESLKPLVRIPPKFSSHAKRTGVSGYTIVQFDLDDAGKTTNPKVIVSWPKDIYEKTSLAALSKWKYTPRAESETDADRQNLITTIRYELQDSSGNPIY